MTWRPSPLWSMRWVGWGLDKVSWKLAFTLSSEGENFASSGSMLCPYVVLWWQAWHGPHSSTALCSTCWLYPLPHYAFACVVQCWQQAESEEVQGSLWLGGGGADDEGRGCCKCNHSVQPLKNFIFRGGTCNSVPWNQGLSNQDTSLIRMLLFPADRHWAWLAVRCVSGVLGATLFWASGDHQVGQEQGSIETIPHTTLQGIRVCAWCLYVYVFVCAWLCLYVCARVYPWNPFRLYSWHFLGNIINFSGGQSCQITLVHVFSLLFSPQDGLEPCEKVLQQCILASSKDSAGHKPIISATQGWVELAASCVYACDR